MIKYLLAGYCLLYLIACNNATPGNRALSGSQQDMYKKYLLKRISLPPGFSINLFAEVRNARSLCLSPSGIVYAGNKSGDKVYAIVDENKDGNADKVYVVAKGLKLPNGVAFREGSLYIATLSQILRLDNIESRLTDPPQPVTVYNAFPSNGHHGWKFIAFGPDGKLYVPVGAPCNICKQEDPIYSSITRMNPDGSGFEIFASGIRNTVGFDWHPLTKELWFTENGRDLMGDDVPEDELNRAPQKGMHFGFPFCHQGNIPDPKYGEGKNCSDYVAPVETLGPHVAALGMRFYTGTQFPPEYQNAIFIARHGSWNRSTPVGYDLCVAYLHGNEVSSFKPFATGWLRPDQSVMGRPVDVLQMPDGALLVSDDYMGVIYRISYKKN